MIDLKGEVMPEQIGTEKCLKGFWVCPKCGRIVDQDYGGMVPFQTWVEHFGLQRRCPWLCEVFMEPHGVIPEGNETEIFHM